LLASLPQGIAAIVVVELQTLLQRLAPRNYIDAHAFAIKQGRKLDLESFRARLVAAGYASATQVMAPGEFAVRGLAARSVSDGIGGTVSHRSIRR